MKSAVDRITTKDRKLLALFYGTDTHAALERLLEAEKMEYMEQHVGERDILQVRYLTGGIGSLNKLMVDLKANFKSNQKS